MVALAGKRDEETRGNCAVSAWRTGLSRCRRAVPAQSVSRPGHYSDGAAGISARAAGELHREKALSAGTRPLRHDRPTLADRAADRAAARKAGLSALPLCRSCCDNSDALLEAVHRGCSESNQCRFTAGPAGAAAFVSALFVRDDSEQPEGMAPRLRQA